jgi:hypothetical protein
MDRLLEELTGKGLVGPREAQWALERSGERQIPVDSALLEMDLLDEEGLLQALRACTGIVAASGADLAALDVEAAKGLPQSFARSFSMCPLRRSDKRVVALVKWPLAGESVEELRDVFRIELEQRVAPSHVIAMALERIYGIAAGPFFHALEEKLERRRKIEDVAGVLTRLRGSPSLSSALASVLTFATARAEYACFFARQGDALRPLTASASGTVRGAPLALPDRASTLWPALCQGGYFLGPLTGGEADARFYRDLQRPQPRWVCVIPAPVGTRSSLVFYSDNGDRGLATRWVAEWVLLVSRIGQTGGIRPDVGVAPPSPATSGGADGERDSPPHAPAPESPEPTLTLSLTTVERRVLDKLAGAAASAGQPLDVFVDRLLAARPHEAVDEAARTSLLVGEVKGFFEKLASEIPAHFARGMEAAFRDLAPRMVAMAPPAAPAHAPSAPSATMSAAGVQLVAQPAAPREVATYQSKRRKTERVKL